MRRFCITGLQIDTADRDNVEMITGAIASAKNRYPWVDMFVLGELSPCGFSFERAEPEDGRAARAFCRAARESNVWLIPGSMFLEAGGKVFNNAIVIDPSGTVVAQYRKIFPFYPYEAGVTPGESLCVFDVPGIGRFGLSICYDLWFPELQRSLAWLGAEVLINVSSTYSIDREVELSISRATAAVNQCYLFNVNSAGRLGLGRSIVCGPGGEVIHQAGSGAEVFPVELDLDCVDRVRRGGWHGLAQALKSLRDSRMRFPPYEPGARSDALAALGPIEMKKPARHPIFSGTAAQGPP